MFRNVTYFSNNHDSVVSTTVASVVDVHTKHYSTYSNQHLDALEILFYFHFTYVKKDL